MPRIGKEFSILYVKETYEEKIFCRYGESFPIARRDVALYKEAANAFGFDVLSKCLETVQDFEFNCTDFSGSVLCILGKAVLETV